MRVAWVGPAPIEGGGATSVGLQLLLELAAAGVEVDCFVAGEPEDIAPSLRDVPGLRFFFSPKRWRWGRWYSRTPLFAFFSGHLARLRAQLRIAELIVERHRLQPYDVVYQFSQSEYTPLRRRRSALPPIAVHPSTHAAGELRWVRNERGLARRCEPVYRRFVVRAMLEFRSFVQSRELPRADRVLAVSRRFGEHLANDYRIPAQRLGVVPNPVDIGFFRPDGSHLPGQGRPVTFLFVSRISARKGVEMVVALSRRLADLKGQIRILVFGGPTLWSNYGPLLADLNPDIATYHGQLTAAQLALLYASSDALIQPSLYEPFGLTVAEGLATGRPVVASDEVGAVAGVDPRVCATFPAGDVLAFESAVRNMYTRLISGEGEILCRLARAEAERLFAPEIIAERLIDELRLAAGGTGSREASPQPPTSSRLMSSPTDEQPQRQHLGATSSS